MSRVWPQRHERVTDILGPGRQRKLRRTSKAARDLVDGRVERECMAAAVRAAFARLQRVLGRVA